ncbi:MAG: anaerobic sulfatase maturase [Terriglobia bacterium]|nr:MAG: anaerobic sulfatase maturase [Terriglobia bacterium]
MCRGLREKTNKVFPILSGTGPSLATVSGPVPRISSILIKPASAVCNLDCEYCFYLDREADPYAELPQRTMTLETLEKLVEGYLLYSYPQSVFAFQGGEPTLAGLKFFQALVEFQQHHGRNGQSVSNSIQTNGILLDREWCEFFRSYNFLVGLSLDGPEDVHDRYRYNKSGHRTWAKVVEAAELLRSTQVEFNVLCVISKANVGRARDLYSFFQRLGIKYLQFIPLAEFEPDGTPMPFTISAEEYGRFLCEVFDLWWPERRQRSIRFFENIAEALAGRRPGTCTMHASCDSYAVVEYNGDVYPCDFFVETAWKLGNIELDSWPEISRRQRRLRFAEKKAVPHAECAVCEYSNICHGGCPKLRHAQYGRFADLDWFCGSYKKIFARALPQLERDVRNILAARPRSD